MDDVTIAGNQAVSDSAIVSGLAMRPPRGLIIEDRARFDRLQMEVDVDRIEGFYARRGFFDAKVTDVAVERLGDDEVRVRFQVREGKPSRVASVTADGLPEELERGAIWRGIRAELKPGSVYRHVAYLNAKQELRGALNEAGYAHASVDGVVHVDRGARRAEIRFQIAPGPKVRFGEIDIRGLDEVPESSVRARAPFEPGDLFDPDLLEVYRGRLYELGVFRAARVNIERENSPAVATVSVNLEESYGRELRLGGGVAADDRHWEVRARAGYLERGFWGPLTSLRAELRPGYSWLRGDVGHTGFGGEGLVELERRDLFTPLSRGLARVSYRVTELEGYTHRGPGTRLGFSRSFFGERLSIGVGWELHWLQFSRVADAIDDATRDRLSLVDPYRLAFFEQSVGWDARDSLFDPTHGYYLRLYAEQGGAYAGGEHDYVRATVEARGYVPLGDRWVLAARTSYGQRLAGDLPITQRYFGGGASRHRGFAHRRLSPYVGGIETEAVPIGGEASWENSGEVRFDAVRLWDQWVGIVPFVDVGDVGASADDLDPANLHWAAGLGLRYGTPVGPLRFDVARRVTRTGAGEPAAGNLWAFHFSLGEAF